MITFREFLNNKSLNSESLSESDSKPLDSRDFPNEKSFLEAAKKDPLVKKILSKVKSLGFSCDIWNLIYTYNSGIQGSDDCFLGANYREKGRSVLDPAAVEVNNWECNPGPKNDPGGIHFDWRVFTDKKDALEFIKVIKNAGILLEFFRKIDKSKLPKLYKD